MGCKCFGVGSWTPTLATKTKTSRGWGTRDDRVREFALAHPSDKNKDVARMGHPGPEAVRALEGLADGVVEGGADLADGLVGAVGPGAIGEQDYGDAGVEIDPQ
jgi:hypothetical protein